MPRNQDFPTLPLNGSDLIERNGDPPRAAAGQESVEACDLRACPHVLGRRPLSTKRHSYLYAWSKDVRSGLALHPQLDAGVLWKTRRRPEAEFGWQPCRLLPH